MYAINEPGTEQQGNSFWYIFISFLWNYGGGGGQAYTKREKSLATGLFVSGLSDNDFGSYQGKTEFLTKLCRQFN